MAQVGRQLCRAGVFWQKQNGPKLLSVMLSVMIMGIWGMCWGQCTLLIDMAQQHGQLQSGIAP
jgi:hypothetical protein